MKLLEVSGAVRPLYSSLDVKRLRDEYELWGLKLHAKKINYMPTGNTSRDFQLEDGKGLINHENKYTYLGVSITKEDIASHKLMRVLIEDEQL